MDINNKSLSEMTASELEQLVQQKKAEESKEQELHKKRHLQEKNDFLQEVIDFFEEKQSVLKIAKKSFIERAKYLNEQKYKIEGKQVKEAKSFEHKNEKIKIVEIEQEKFDFTDEAIVHINAIKDIFKEKFELRNKGWYSLLDALLIRNSEGEYDPKLLIKIRKQARELGDEALIAEVDKLSDCQIVSGTAEYFRVYKKNERNKWEEISLNFSRF